MSPKQLLENFDERLEKLPDIGVKHFYLVNAAILHPNG